MCHFLCSNTANLKLFPSSQHAATRACEFNRVKTKFLDWTNENKWRN